MDWSLSSKQARLLVWALGLAGLYALAVALRSATAFEHSGAALSVGLAVDLTVTASLLTWVTVVRSGVLPRAVLVPVFLVGVAIASALVPGEHGHVVLALAYAWAAAEAAFALVAIGRARRLVRAFRDQRAMGAPVGEAFEHALTVHLPSATLAGFIASELAVLWYGVAGWWATASGGPFADRDLRQWRLVAWVLAFLVTAEGIGAHVLLRSWSEAAAWTATALHVYSLVWLFGDLNALRAEGTTLRSGVLRVRLGLRARADVPVERIERVERLPADAGGPDEEDDYLRAHVLFAPNAVLHLARPVEARLLFGRRRTVRRIGLALSDPRALPGG